MDVDIRFLDHWRVTYLKTLTGLENAATKVLRLWLFCDEKKRYDFYKPFFTPDILCAICLISGNADKAWKDFIESGIILEYKNMDTGEDRVVVTGLRINKKLGLLKNNLKDW
jgi:hypothetical protein